MGGDGFAVHFGWSQNQTTSLFVPFFRYQPARRFWQKPDSDTNENSSELALTWIFIFLPGNDCYGVHGDADSQLKGSPISDEVTDKPQKTCSHREKGLINESYADLIVFPRCFHTLTSHDPNRARQLIIWICPSSVQLFQCGWISFETTS